VPRDHERAFDLYRAAASAGLVDAQYNLGVLYVRGDGVERDLLAAYPWFELVVKRADVRLAAQAQASLTFVESLMSAEDLEEARATPIQAGAAP
jgi:hypothetical protein